VLAALSEAIARGVIGFDAVKHLVLCRIERRPPRLDLKIHPYLPQASVTATSAQAYLELPRFGGQYWAWVFNGIGCLRLFALAFV
jgi:hypothetical protein